MKKYVITKDKDFSILHQHVSGPAYTAIAFGTHNEIAQYVKKNNLDLNEEVK